MCTACVRGGMSEWVYVNNSRTTGNQSRNQQQFIIYTHIYLHVLLLAAQYVKLICTAKIAKINRIFLPSRVCVCNTFKYTHAHTHTCIFHTKLLQSIICMHTVYGGIRFFGIYILIGWNFDDFNLVQESEFYDALRWTILGEGEHMIKTKNEIEWIGAAKTWTGQNAEEIKPKTLGWLELLIHWINYNFGLKKKIEINMCATPAFYLLYTQFKNVYECRAKESNWIFPTYSCFCCCFCHSMRISCAIRKYANFQMTSFVQFTAFFSSFRNTTSTLWQPKKAHKILMVSIVAVNHQIEYKEIYCGKSLLFTTKKYLFSISYQLIIHWYCYHM